MSFLEWGREMGKGNDVSGNGNDSSSVTRAKARADSSP